MYIFLLFLILETERENEETTYITTFANFHSTYELLFFLCWSDIFATQKHFYKNKYFSRTLHTDNMQLYKYFLQYIILLYCLSNKLQN